MLKIKIKDKPDYIESKIKSKSYNALECIVLLDMAIDMLENDFEMSDKEIYEFLKEYRKNKEEVE